MQIYSLGIQEDWHREDAEPHPVHSEQGETQRLRGWSRSQTTGPVFPQSAWGPPSGAFTVLMSAENSPNSP